MRTPEANKIFNKVVIADDQIYRFDTEAQELVQMMTQPEVSEDQGPPEDSSVTANEPSERPTGQGNAVETITTEEEIKVPIEIVNTHESEENFSPEALADMIDFIIGDFAGWKQKVSGQQTKVWESAKGSLYSTSQPFVKAQYLLENTTDINEVLEALIDMDKRKEWDDSILFWEILAKPEPNITVKRIAYEEKLGLRTRDYLDKWIVFRRNKCVYVYISWVPDDLLPPEKKFERAVSVLGYYKIEATFNSEDGSRGVMLYSGLQSDVRHGWGFSNEAHHIAPVLLTEWSEKLRKYLSNLSNSFS